MNQPQPIIRPAPGRSTTETRPRTPRRLGLRLGKYVGRELVFPTFFTWLGLAVLALTAQLLAFSDLVINRGLDAGDVGWLAVYQLLPALARSLPFAALIGTLIGLGRLGRDRELLAMQASGIAPGRVGIPVLVFAAVLTALSFALSLAAAPWAARGLAASLAAMVQEHPAATLRAGAVNAFGDFRLQAREVSSAGDELRGVMLWVPSIRETFFAKEASVEPMPDGGTRVTLGEGILLTGTAPPSYMRFHHMRHVLPAAGAGSDAPAVALLGMPGDALRAAAATAEDPWERREAAVEWQRRLSLPVATFWLAALAVPLALWRSQGTRTSGALLGIAATVVYYGMVQVGNGLLRDPKVPVELAVWLPNAALVAIAGALWWAILRGPQTARPSGPAGREDAERAARAARPHRRPLDRYVLALFAETAVLCFLAMLAVFVVGDVVDNLQWFAKYQSTVDEVLRFYTARVPVLASRVVPMALLVAATLTMSLLIVRGELIGMWSCGVSTLRAVRSILALCALLAVSYYGLSGELVPRATARASYLKQTEIKKKDTSEVRTSLWYRDGDRLYVMQRLDPLAGEASDVTVYELGPDWLPRSRTDAAFARHVGGGIWSLDEPLRVEVSDGGARIAPAEAFAELGEDVPAEVDTSHLTVSDLREAIADVERSGYDATNYRVDLHQKIASPFAVVLLPALGLLVATAGPPFWTPAQALVLCAVQAIAYLVLSGVATSLGYGRFVSPAVAGYAPVAVVTGAVGWLALRSRGRRG